MDHGVYNFTISESFYLRSLETAVTGIKEAIVKDLALIAKAMFPPEAASYQSLTNFIQANYGEARGAAIVNKLKVYDKAVAIYEELINLYEDSYGTRDYRIAVIRNPNSELFNKGGEANVNLTTNELKLQRALAVQKAASEKEVIYSFLSGLMREEILYVCRERIRSEVFQVLLRRAIVMPDFLEDWTAPFITRMFSVHVH